MAAQIVVLYNNLPVGSLPATAVDQFNAHDGVELKIVTTPSGVLEIRAMTNGEIIKAYAPGRWIDAKVID
jgi:hypothetical protein